MSNFSGKDLRNIKSNWYGPTLIFQVTLIGVSPYLVNIVLYLLGEARRSQKEPRELKLPGDAQRKVQFSDM